MSEAALRDVLAANAAFYRAFAAGDFQAMDALWARRAPVACTHPGWRALIGRDAVLASWAAILSAPERPAIVCFAPHAVLLGETALVLCYEDVGAWLAATNVFVREDGAWRMVHHHAGPARDAPAEEPASGRMH
ncbi:MAG: nuclear transport factor 2 family protein [Alphaproteobacteria bacterium]